MSHHHGHNHAHGHSHAPANTRRLAIACLIAVILLLAQLVGSLITRSLALLVDTVHVLTDSTGLIIALCAAWLAKRPHSPKRTWGWRRIEVLSAIFQAAALLAVGIFVLIEAAQRFFQDHEIPGTELLIFGAVGLAGNLLMLLILMGGDRTNFNMRAAFLEVINDALGSVAVIVGALVVQATGWSKVDSIIALFLGALILPRTIKLLKETGGVLLENTPNGLDAEDIRRHIESKNPHVLAVHDLHISQISSDLPVLTAHVILEDKCFTNGHSIEILKELQQCVAEHFEVSIRHSTFQLEPVSLTAGDHYDNLP